MPEAEAIAWERLRDESAQAYEAFCTYRDMGSARSLDRAYARYVEAVNARGGRQLSASGAPGRWNLWCRDNVWVQRAAAYDLDCERRRRREREQKREEQYQADLEELRKRQKQLGAASQLHALTLMNLASKRLNGLLKAVNDAEVAGASPAVLAKAELGLKELPLKTLPAFFRAAAALAEAGTNAESVALGLVELMKALDGASDTSNHQ